MGSSANSRSRFVTPLARSRWKTPEREKDMSDFFSPAAAKKEIANQQTANSKIFRGVVSIANLHKLPAFPEIKLTRRLIVGLTLSFSEQGDPRH